MAEHTFVQRLASATLRRRSRTVVKWRRLRWFVSPTVALLLLLAWHVVTGSDAVPEYMLPAPGAVLESLREVLGDGSLLRHAGVTLQETLLGLALGLGLAVSVGYLLAKVPLVEQVLAPYIVALQAVPIVAIAPLLIIWFGSGTSSKVVTCVLIVFFPMLVNTIIGVRQVEPDLRDLMASLNASRWQVFRHLEVPAALPVLLGGLKVSATLSVIGAVVGEFVGANEGLGFLVNSARSVFNVPLVYVAVFTLTVMALLLYTSVHLLEWRVLAWRRRCHGGFV